MFRNFFLAAPVSCANIPFAPKNFVAGQYVVVVTNLNERLHHVVQAPIAARRLRKAELQALAPTGEADRVVFLFAVLE